MLFLLCLHERQRGEISYTGMSSTENWIWCNSKKTARCKFIFVRTFSLDFISFLIWKNHISCFQVINVGIILCSIFLICPHKCSVMFYLAQMFWWRKTGIYVSLICIENLVLWYVISYHIILYSYVSSYLRS